MYNGETETVLIYEHFNTWRDGFADNTADSLGFIATSCIAVRLLFRGETGLSG